MKAEKKHLRARVNPSHGWALIAALAAVALVTPIGAQEGAATSQRWPEPEPVRWPHDAAETSTGTPVIAAKLPFRLFPEKEPISDPFAGAEAQRRLAEQITPAHSASSQQTTNQTYPWPEPVGSNIEPGYPASRTVEVSPPHVAVADTEQPFIRRGPLTKLKLPPLGKGRLRKAIRSAVAPESANMSHSETPSMPAPGQNIPNFTAPPAAIPEIGEVPNTSEVSETRGVPKISIPVPAPGVTDMKLSLPNLTISETKALGLEVSDTALPQYSHTNPPSARIKLPVANLSNLNPTRPTSELPTVDQPQFSLPQISTPSFQTDHNASAGLQNSEAKPQHAQATPADAQAEPVAVAQAQTGRIPAPQIQQPAVAPPDAAPTLAAEHDFQLPDINEPWPNETRPQVNTPAISTPGANSAVAPRAALSQAATATSPNVAGPQSNLPKVETPQLILPDLDEPRFPQVDLPPIDDDNASQPLAAQAPPSTELPQLPLVPRETPEFQQAGLAGTHGDPPYFVTPQFEAASGTAPPISAGNSELPAANPITPNAESANTEFPVSNHQLPGFPEIESPQLLAPPATESTPDMRDQQTAIRALPENSPPENAAPQASLPESSPQTASLDPSHFGSNLGESNLQLPAVNADTAAGSESHSANKIVPQDSAATTAPLAPQPPITQPPITQQPITQQPITTSFNELEQARTSGWGGAADTAYSAATESYSVSNQPPSSPLPPPPGQTFGASPQAYPQPAATVPRTELQAQSAAPVLPQAVENSPLVASTAKSPPAKDEKTGNLVEASRVLALVGNQSILAGDVLGQVNELLKPYEGKAPEDELEQQRQLLVQQALPNLIDNKLVFLDFLRTIPPDKLPDLEKRVFELFSETELPKLVEKAGVKTNAELDAKLRELGSSLDKQRRLFMEKSIAGQMVRRNVDTDKDVTHDEMLQYYYDHSDDYELQARARWEQLMTRFDKFESRKAAWIALAEMGNEVLRGAPSQAVARRSSQGPRAKDGGVHDWTTKGSLVSEELDKALFTLPAGRWSQIIEDDDGFHIVRVMEREPAGKVPFADVQDEIKEKIKRKRFNEGVAKYLAGLRESTYVWTAFEGELGGDRQQIARPLTPSASTLR